MLAIFLLIAPCALAVQTLEAGASGETVMVLTRRLCDLGYMAEPVDAYGEEVASAVGDFQTANALERTGIADSATQQLLYSDRAVMRADCMAAFIGKYAGKAYKVGDSGEGVASIQQLLKNLGYYSGAADGAFGEATRRALVEYQRANGLEPAGAADTSTLIRLFESDSVPHDEFILSQCAAKGDSGAKVKSVQARLNALGYFTGDSTGTYGENTERAVALFQASNSLAETGSVDAVTYETLFSDDAVAAAGDGSLHYGAQGDEVFSLQQRLSELGFLDTAPDGSYGRSTETAVMLFCAANGLEISPDATSQVMLVVAQDSAKDASALVNTVKSVDSEIMTDVCGLANAMVGDEFIDTGDRLFPGFEFIRYIFARKGIDVSQPSDIIDRIGEKTYSASDIAPGNIVVLSRDGENAMTLNFTICTGAEVVIYLDAASGTVAAAPLYYLDYSSAYVWNVVDE